jgi:hypothetical protein
MMMVKKLKPRRGIKMPVRGGWTLTAPGGQVYKGTLIRQPINHFNLRLAIFNVPKRNGRHS